MKNQKKIILDLCGGTGSWSEPFKKAGFHVVNLTLPDCDIRKCVFSKEHFHNQIETVEIKNIYGVLAAPPCTQFSKANTRVGREGRNFKQGMETVRACLNIIWGIQERGANLKFWALENPLGFLYNFLGQPAFYFQPWQFGETDFRSTKRTGIWGYFKEPVKTVFDRPIPLIRKNEKHGRKQVLFEFKEQRQNFGFGSHNPAERARTSSYFAEAFFKANSKK